MISNVHQSILPASLEEVSELVDTLGSENDRLWPRQNWPRMRLERPWKRGSRGRHGPIAYFIEDYRRGQLVLFRFTAPRGFDGTHGLYLEEVGPAQTRLTHRIILSTSPLAWLRWHLIIRPLHDALLRDLLHGAALQLGQISPPPKWSPYVRFLRAVWAPRR